MNDYTVFVAHLRWEAANLRAMRWFWLIEPQDLVAVADRLEAMAFAMCAVTKDKAE